MNKNAYRLVFNKSRDVSVNASSSKGKGSSNAQDTSFTNTSISAGNTATIKSGGDTNVVGGVVAANTIKADVGGSLSIESLQDKSSYTSNQKSMGASIPITALGSLGGSVSASKSNVDSNFQSVGQQCGLKAGDGGFQHQLSRYIWFSRQHGSVYRRRRNRPETYL